MSVRVNLLPGDVAARDRANRLRIILAGVGALFLAALGVVSVLTAMQITDAETQLAAVQAENASLQADIAGLQPFGDLEQRASGAVATVASALEREASIASILQDLSAVLPANAQLDTLSVVITPEPTAPSPGGTRLVEGRISATGQTVDGLAPGVERLLIDLGRVASFDNVYVTTSTMDENGITMFVIEIELGPEVLTERYGFLDLAVTR